MDRNKEMSVAGKKTSKKKSAAKKTAPKTAKKSGSGRKPNAAFMRELQPSEDLAAVVGNKPLSRPMVVKKIWEYIKKNKLQDAQKRQSINADDKLRPVFGGKKQVTMFEMNSLLGKHLKAT